FAATVAMLVEARTNLAAANRNLARALVQKADRAAFDRDLLAAEVILARALTLDDDPATRARLVSARADTARVAWTSAAGEGGGPIAFVPGAALALAI